MRDFSRFSRDSFNFDADNFFSSFYNKFNKLISKHAPMKTMSNRKAKQLSKPWITKGIKIFIKVKNKLYASSDTTNYKIYIGTKFVP